MKAGSSYTVKAPPSGSLQLLEGEDICFSPHCQTSWQPSPLSLAMGHEDHSSYIQRHIIKWTDQIMQMPTVFLPHAFSWVSRASTAANGISTAGEAAQDTRHVRYTVSKGTKNHSHNFTTQLFPADHTVACPGQKNTGICCRKKPRLANAYWHSLPQHLVFCFSIYLNQLFSLPFILNMADSHSKKHFSERPLQTYLLLTITSEFTKYFHIRHLPATLRNTKGGGK